jgi:hypothetical protein
MLGPPPPQQTDTPRPPNFNVRFDRRFFLVYSMLPCHNFEIGGGGGAFVSSMPSGPNISSTYGTRARLAWVILKSFLRC